jgi:hypothetical protein
LWFSKNRRTGDFFTLPEGLRATNARAVLLLIVRGLSLIVRGVALIVRGLSLIVRGVALIVEPNAVRGDQTGRMAQPRTGPSDQRGTAWSG